MVVANPNMFGSQKGGRGKLRLPVITLVSIKIKVDVEPWHIRSGGDTMTKKDEEGRKADAKGQETEINRDTQSHTAPSCLASNSGNHRLSSVCVTISF